MAILFLISALLAIPVIFVKVSVWTGIPASTLISIGRIATAIIGGVWFIAGAVGLPVVTAIAMVGSGLVLITSKVIVPMLESNKNQ